MSGLISPILGGMALSAAEKAFRPWWDNIEDHIIYLFVLVGVIIAPSSLVMTSTLDCNYCQGDACPEGDNSDVPEDVEPFNLFFVKKFCSIVGPLHNFVLYFPYILLFFAALLVMVDRPFVQILYNSFNIDRMYKLLVEDDPYTQKIDRKKEKNELISCLYGANRYFMAYLLRTMASLIVSGVPFSVMMYFLWEFDDDVFTCNVHGRLYECTGHPTSFYRFVMFICMSMLAMYFLINVWNIVWLTFPKLNSFCNLMYAFRRKRMKMQTININQDPRKRNDTEDILDDLYFGNRNVRLLLSLLSSSSGIPGPLRSLALIDPLLCSALLPKLQGWRENRNDRGDPEVDMRFFIPEHSLLHHIHKMKSYPITFLVEYKDKECEGPTTVMGQGQAADKDQEQKENGLHETFPHFHEGFTWTIQRPAYKLTSCVTVSTIIGGHIVASHTYPPPFKSDVALPEMELDAR